MAKEKERPALPNRKISETFLDFAEPLLETVDRKAGKEGVEKILQIAFTVWNSVVFDTVGGSGDYVAKLRQCIENDPIAAALIEFMISRKKAMFGDDLRLIGEYSVTKKLGGWNLRAEARDPRERGRP